MPMSYLQGLRKMGVLTPFQCGLLERAEVAKTTAIRDSLLSRIAL